MFRYDIHTCAKCNHDVYMNKVLCPKSNTFKHTMQCSCNDVDRKNFVGVCVTCNTAYQKKIVELNSSQLNLSDHWY